MKTASSEIRTIAIKAYGSGTGSAQESLFFAQTYKFTTKASSWP